MHTTGAAAPRLVLLFLALVPSCRKEAAATAAAVKIDTSKERFEVDKRFVSFTMDAGGTGHWGSQKSGFWYNELARSLAKPLAPAFFRYGGTGEDYTLYDFTEAGPQGNPPPDEGREPMVMNATVFTGLVDFSAAAGWELIYGVNYLDRIPASNSWDPKPLTGLLGWLAGRNITMAGWELGNV